MDSKIDYSYEQISENEEEILWRVTYTIFGIHQEIWFTERKGHP